MYSLYNEYIYIYLCAALNLLLNNETQNTKLFKQTKTLHNLQTQTHTHHLIKQLTVIRVQLMGVEWELAID